MTDKERSGPGLEVAPDLKEAFGDLVRAVMLRGRSRARDAAAAGRHRLEVRQLQKDRDAFWIRLGKTAYRLVEGGEIDHPALRKAMERIDELERALDARTTTPPLPGSGERD